MEIKPLRLASLFLQTTLLTLLLLGASARADEEQPPPPTPGGTASVDISIVYHEATEEKTVYIYGPGGGLVWSGAASGAGAGEAGGTQGWSVSEEDSYVVGGWPPKFVGAEHCVFKVHVSSNAYGGAYRLVYTRYLDNGAGMTDGGEGSFSVVGPPPPVPDDGGGGGGEGGEGDPPIPGPTATPQPTVTPTPPPPPPPDVTFPSTLRACAGGVDDHEAPSQYQAHTRKIELSATTGEELAANTSLTLEFENNQGHDYGDERDKKTARLHKTDEPFDAEHPWRETLDVQTDGEGKVSVWVLSSDVICQPRLVAKWQNEEGEMVEVGSVTCDFAASVTFRHFANPIDPDDPDDYGWIFDFPGLMNPNSNKRSTPAKVYLKFKVFPDKPDNYAYFDSNGVERGNWQFVNGHELLMRVSSVEVADNNTGQVREIKGTPQQLKRYAFVVSNSTGATDADEVTAKRATTAQGETAPQAHVFAGTDIDDVSTIYVEAEDQTEWSH